MKKIAGHHMETLEYSAKKASFDADEFTSLLTASHELLVKSGSILVFDSANLPNLQLDGLSLARFGYNRTVQTESGPTIRSFDCTYSFSGANFNYSHFSNCRFVLIMMTGASFKGCVFTRCIFSGVKLREADFEGSTFNECVFYKNDMDLVCFKDVRINTSDAFLEKTRGVDAQTFKNNKMKSINLQGADLGEANTDDFLNASLFSSKRPQLLGLHPPILLVNSVGRAAEKLVEDWEIIVGKDRCQPMYQNILVCLSKLSINVKSLAINDINSLHNATSLKKPLKAFIKDHKVILKTLQRQVAYKYILHRMFQTMTVSSFPKDLVGLIFSHTGNVVPVQPFFNKTRVKKASQHKVKVSKTPGNR